MPRQIELNTVQDGVSVTTGMPAPVWYNIPVTDAYEAWGLRMYSHPLMGAISIRIFWLKETKAGTIALYRNDEHVCDLELDKGREQSKNIDEFKDRAWGVALDYLTVVSVHLQNYISLALKVDPGSEDKDAPPA